MLTTSEPVVSVIIPTYNRKESLLRTLESLRRQTYCTRDFEVILVDDGGNDGTKGAVTNLALPFDLNYLWQENQGGVRARNRGAEVAKGELLVFLDDDMSPDPQYLETLVRIIGDSSRFIARGRLRPWESYTSIFAQRQTSHFEGSGASAGKFSSNNLAIRKDDFWSLGCWFDLLPGIEEHRGGIWADLEFAVRASQHGYQLVTIDGARIVHCDYAIVSLDSACERAYMVSKLAVPIIEHHPELVSHMPMFEDKGPISWSKDTSALVLRKVARQFASARLPMWIMQELVLMLERHTPTSNALTRLYRWIISGYIYRGYREGMRMEEHANSEQ